DAARNDNILPVEQVIRNNAKERREKLIRIGLAYDLAHSKGRYSETAEEKASRLAHEKWKKDKDRAEMKKKIMKERENVRYTRLKDARKRKKARAKSKARHNEAKKKRRSPPHTGPHPWMRSQPGRSPKEERPEDRAAKTTEAETEKRVNIKEPGGRDSSKDGD